MAATLKGQLFLSGKTACPRFSVNKMRLNMRNAEVVCISCGSPLLHHCAEAVSSADVTLFFAHQEAKMGANMIVDPQPQIGLTGAVYVGGMSASINPFVTERAIRRVVNCSDLHLMKRPDFVTWAQKVEQLQQDAVLVDVLRLGWRDDLDQKLWVETEFDQLMEAVRFVHASRCAGDNCLVHCAQGKSRSGTVAIAYLMATDPSCATYQAALAKASRRRNIIEPNPCFAEQLEAFSRSSQLAILQEEL
eukprot:CAMPEP_0178420508 /NCGR_PEP_ID=MMETSP0689_2-20121128/26167_1 /TAXON_ID=160604 /ORGANISM="Amphidinium massartii, Strain CS-259" /LENGTH=247 /DNA_ID=CAMNT_0020041989 /DNA_START=71 /DNA_END=811 /DNA_ORIENTATION=+